jgi:hypothetical protein
MNTVKIKNIGCAAWLRMTGRSLLRVEPQAFIFDLADETESDVLVGYQNSQFFTFDKTLLGLRDLQARARARD